MYEVQNAEQDWSWLIKGRDLDTGSEGRSLPHRLWKIPRLTSERCTQESAELCCFWHTCRGWVLPWRYPSSLGTTSSLPNQGDALRSRKYGLKLWPIDGTDVRRTENLLFFQQLYLCQKWAQAFSKMIKQYVKSTLRSLLKKMEGFIIISAFMHLEPDVEEHSSACVQNWGPD